MIQAIEPPGDGVSSPLPSPLGERVFSPKCCPSEKVSDVEVASSEYERLQEFGARMRITRMKPGDEFIELTEYLAPQGRPIPVDSRSNDRWFQHVAIVVSDMDKAYQHLRAHKIRHASHRPADYSNLQ